MDFHWIFYRSPWNSGVTIPNITIVPWNSMELGWCHFKWHRVPWNSIKLCRRHTKCRQFPWNSMELVASHFIWHRGSMGYSMEFHGTMRSPNQISPSSMEFHGTWGCHFKWHQGSMEFNGIFHGIPWNSAAAKSDVTKFHGIPRNFEIITFIDIRTPFEYSMELWSRLTKCHQVSQNFIELGDC